MTDLPRPHGIRQLAFPGGIAIQETGICSRHCPKDYRCIHLAASFRDSHLMQDNQHVAVSHDMDGIHDVIEPQAQSIYDINVNRRYI